MLPYQPFAYSDWAQKSFKVSCQLARLGFCYHSSSIIAATDRSSRCLKSQQMQQQHQQQQQQTNRAKETNLIKSADDGH